MVGDMLEHWTNGVLVATEVGSSVAVALYAQSNLSSYAVC
jgi:hypothetical protein